MSLATIAEGDLQAPARAQVPRKARPARATNRPQAEGPRATRKVSFYLSPETIRRLDVAASMTDSDRSKVAEAIFALAPDLRRWVVSDRAKPTGQASPSESGDRAVD